MKLRRELRKRLPEARIAAGNRVGGMAVRRESRNAEPKVIVSMTTYPPRLKRCYLALESILAGDVLPEALILWVAREEISPSSIPRTLRRLERRGLEIRFADNNYRSADKLVHSLAAWPAKVIVTADDDVLYGANWLQSMLAVHARDPASIVCHRGHRLRLKGPRELVTYSQMKDSGVGGSSPTLALMPTGVSGVLYPPGSLAPWVADRNLFLALCPSADDVWFKAASLELGTLCRRVANADTHFSHIRGSQAVSLMSLNVEQRENDVALKRVFDYFDLWHRLE